MTDTGSALLDKLVARRRELDKLFRRPPTMPAPVPIKLPLLRMEPQKTVAERISDAKKLRGKISEVELYTIMNDIYGSARDCGDNSLDMIPDCEPEKISPGVPSITSIQSLVAEHCHLTISEIISKRRTYRITLPRQIAMYLCRKFTRKSYPEISRRFSNRDHATIIHAVRKIELLIANDASFAEEIEALKAMVLG